MLFKSWGKLRYNKDSLNRWLVVDVDDDIARYYRALMPKYIRINPPMYPAHISVVSKELIPKEAIWGVFDGAIIEFFYENVIYNSPTYYWLDVYSKRLEEIRRSLGLPVDCFYGKPRYEGFLKTFHITIGNTKG